MENNLNLYICKRYFDSYESWKGALLVLAYTSEDAVKLASEKDEDFFMKKHDFSLVKDCFGTGEPRVIYDDYTR